MSMKKVKFKKRYIVLSLIGLLTMGYFAFRYYIRPDWFDSKHIYHKVYDYKVSDVKPQKKVIQDINIEFIYDKDVEKPSDGQWEESTRTDVRLYDNDSVLHVTFTDKSKATIPIFTSRSGPAFSEESIDSRLFKKLSYRFPELHVNEKRSTIELGSVLMLYQGDTLFQIPGASTEIQFQLKNPKTGKLQTYYQYGGAPDFNYFRPVYFLQYQSNSTAENQAFFDDYDPSKELNYWDTRYDLGSNTLDVKQDYSFYNLFYSNQFSNLPVGISTTGDTFKTTITETYVIEDVDGGDKAVKVVSRSKTYTDKMTYTTEVLDKKLNNSR